MLPRKALNQIEKAFKVNPVVALLGPRQSGKSTLARLLSKQFKANNIWFFDLENPKDLARLENPSLALSSLSGIIIIDEIQKRPDLFPYLRVLVDEKKRKIKILILGSASRDLIQQSSETLAGRISYIELNPFATNEVDDIPRLHLRGGFPLSYLASSDSKSFDWRKSYVSTFLERDLFDFGYKIAPATIRRFWMMLAHYHGQLLNFSELGRSFGVSDVSARKYVELLSETFMIRLLQPWHENLSKRQVKTPKLYFRDSGIFHTLLDLETKRDLLLHPKLGASWEGFALEQVLRIKNLRQEECFFWATHNQAELDLIIFEKGKRIGFEFKYSDAPKVTASMKIAIENLQLHELFIVTPKGEKFSMAPKITSIGLQHL